MFETGTAFCVWQLPPQCISWPTRFYIIKPTITSWCYATSKKPGAMQLQLPCINNLYFVINELFCNFLIMLLSIAKEVIFEQTALIKQLLLTEVSSQLFYSLFIMLFTSWRSHRTALHFHLCKYGTHPHSLPRKLARRQLLQQLSVTLWHYNATVSFPSGSSEDDLVFVKCNVVICSCR